MRFLRDHPFTAIGCLTLAVVLGVVSVAAWGVGPIIVVSTAGLVCHALGLPEQWRAERQLNREIAEAWVELGPKVAELNRLHAESQRGEQPVPVVEKAAS